MLVKIFLVSIIIIISIIVLFEINDNYNIKNKPKNKKAKKPNLSCKKVRFNLDENTIKLISPNNKKIKMDTQNQYNEFINKNKDIASTNNISMVNDTVEFNNTTYGNKIMDNSNFFKSTDHVIKNPQVEFVKKINNNTEDNNIFQNQKGYWESQTIDDFVNRTYDNNQVANFNSFRQENSTGKNISSVYDKLSEVDNRDLANTFGDSVLRHDDNSIMGNMDNTLYGYSSDCNQANVD